MRVLITGISGFIGKNLVEFFSKQEGIVVYGSSRNPDFTKMNYGDKVREVVDSFNSAYLDDNQIDVVIHLAGIAHDLKGNYKEEDYFRVNYEGTKVIYEHFLESSASKFIFLSSIKAAVDITDFPVTESIKPSPVTAYGKSKLLAEKFILDQSSKKDKAFYILRPCMVYGPGNKGNLNLLYNFVKKGIPYPFGKFENKRSFLYIENFSFVIGKLLAEPIPSGIYHLSDGQSLSTVELVEAIGRSIHKKVKIWHLPVSLVKVMARLGDLSGTFFNSHTLNKLTESMEVSNEKISNEIKAELPYDTMTGLKKTITTFK